MNKRILLSGDLVYWFNEINASEILIHDDIVGIVVGKAKHERHKILWSNDNKVWEEAAKHLIAIDDPILKEMTVLKQSEKEKWTKKR